MLFTQSLSAACVLASLLLSASASPHARHAAHIRRAAINKVTEPDVSIAPNDTLVAPPRRRSNSRRCLPRKPSGTASVPSASPSSSSASHASSSSAPAPEHTTKATPSPTKSTPPVAGGVSNNIGNSNSNSNSNSGGNAVGNAGKPAFWPTKTQAAATYSATAASAADPLLESVSYALNNKGNALYTDEHEGDLTFYGQGLGACGDTYDDSTYTAALSHLTYDAWPGATAETNRNAICGPFTPGRQVINSLGTFSNKLSSAAGSIMIGGDGFPNCNPTADIKCHIPLTVTITNPNNGKSVVAKIVDRCAGCKGQYDIDVTPTVFNAIADPSVGRIPGIKWRFNQF